MLKSLKISKYPLCIEYFKLANESLDQTAGEPMLLRRAKLHAHVLDHMPIFIEPEDLLCGSGASKPFGLEMQYEYGVWTKDEVESLKSEIYTSVPRMKRSSTASTSALPTTPSTATWWTP
jgi:formate C-acetyltransferase